VDHLEYLFAGFAVFWAGLFGYLLWLQARLRALGREIERLEERLSDDGAAAPARPPAARGAPAGEHSAPNA
jgi:CcmD family protein